MRGVSRRERRGRERGAGEREARGREEGDEKMRIGTRVGKNMRESARARERERERERERAHTGARSSHVYPEFNQLTPSKWPKPRVEHSARLLLFDAHVQ